MSCATHSMHVFLMHSNVEYQCSSPCKYMNGSFFFTHAEHLAIMMFGTNNNSDKVSKWEYIESQKRMTMKSTINCGYSTSYNSMMDVRMLIPLSLSRWSWIFICHSEMPVNTWETTANDHGYSWLFMDIHKSVIDIRDCIAIVHDKFNNGSHN